MYRSNQPSLNRLINTPLGKNLNSSGLSLTEAMQSAQNGEMLGLDNGEGIPQVAASAGQWASSDGLVEMKRAQAHQKWAKSQGIDLIHRYD